MARSRPVVPRPGQDDLSYPAWQRAGLMSALLSLTILVVALVARLPSSISAYGPASAGLVRQLAVSDQRAFEFTPEDFPFDPNTVSKDDLLRLGVPDRRADSWLKYRGDRPRAFRKASDIGKLYGLDAALKARLIALAVIPPEEATPELPAESFAFDPNAVTQAELRRLGLKPYQAKAFINYRAKIDEGFTRPRQLGRLKFLDADQRKNLLSNAVFPPPPARTLKASFSFDPNLISADSLALLGFPDYQARSLVRYRGGRRVTFRKPEDLFRVKSLDSGLVALALPLVQILIPEADKRERPGPARYFPPKPKIEEASIDLNTADTTLLKTLPGVGSYRAMRIVRYREALGGFYTLGQAASTRGLPDSIWRGALPYLKIGPVYRRINVNEASVDELKKHPSINSKLAGAVVRFREKHGPYRDEQDLRRVRLFTEDNLPAILPYLSFE